MFDYALYFMIAIGSTFIGSITGMGGGVIIKPVLDMLGQFDVLTIGTLSSITVLAMSLVSVGRQLFAKAVVDVKLAIYISAGSIAGGYAGQALLRLLHSTASRPELVAITQNAILALLLAAVYLYMRRKDAVKPLLLHGPAPSLLCGGVLGLLSSLLGIGGGPFNVALLIFVFGLSTKSAVLYSLISILFAQLSKLFTVLVTTGFAQYDLTVLPAMVIGGILGGYIGARCNKRLSDGAVERCFNLVLLVVFIISLTNIVRNI